jgi:ABC-type phosphate transport system permease subunit
VIHQSNPIVVKIVEPPHDPTGISDAIIGAIGLTGFIVLIALLLGLIFGGLLFWFRRNSA